MVQAEARTTMAPSLPYSESALVSLPCVSLFGWDSRYLLAVQTAGIGLDRDELLTTDGEAIGKGVVGGGEGRGEGVDILLRELDVREGRLAGTECHPASPREVIHTYRETGRLGLETREIGGEDTGLVEFTRAHQAGGGKSVSDDWGHVECGRESYLEST